MLPSLDKNYIYTHVLSLAIGMLHSIAGEIWKGRSKSLQERVKKLQATITDSITRDGMRQDETEHVNGKTMWL
jgi:hypothetical protein